MNLDQLKYVQTVAKHLSFSKASEELYISQSAISQSISRLEKELNLDFFHRSTKQVTITKNGEIALKLIEEILTSSNKLVNFKKNIREINEINLAVVKGLFLPFMLQLLKNKIEKTKVLFSEDDSISIIENIQAGLIDIGIVPIYEENEHILNSLRVSPIIDISYYVFVSKNSKLASYKNLTLKDIETEQIILFDGSFLKWVFHSTFPLNARLNVLFKSSNQEFIREFISRNQGITIDTIAEVIVNPHVEKGDIIAIPIDFGIKVNSYLGIVANLNNIDQGSFNKLYQLITQYITDEINKAKKLLLK